MYLRQCKPATVTFVPEKDRAVELPTPLEVYSLIRFLNFKIYLMRALK
jgi:hypothetical protein